MINIQVVNAALVINPVASEMNLHTMLEATTSVFTTLGQVNQGDITQSVISSGTVSDSGWTYSAAGMFDNMVLNMAYSGSISGQFGQDIVVSFSGTGSLGPDPLLMSGATTWYYDAVAADYINYDFEQLTKIGANSLWGWVLGGETIVGVAAGILTGIGAAVTGPAAVGLGIVAGSAATGALIGASVGAQTLLTSTAPPKPVQPTPPTIDIGDPVLLAGKIFTATDADGSFTARDLSGRYISTGNISNGSFASESVTVVPVPGAVWLLGSGLFGVFGLGYRKMSEPKH